MTTAQRSNWEDSQLTENATASAESHVDGMSDFVQMDTTAAAEVETAPVKKKGRSLGARLFVVVLLLLLVGVIGFVAMKIIGKKPTGRVSVSASNSVTQIQPSVDAMSTPMGRGTSLLDSTSSSKTSPTGVDDAVAAQKIAQAGGAVLGPPPFAAAPVAPVVPVPPVRMNSAAAPAAVKAAIDPAQLNAMIDGRLAAQNARVEQLQNEVQALRTQLATGASNMAAKPAAATNQSAGSASTAMAPRKTYLSSRRSAERRVASRASKAEQVVPEEIARLQLRGVYPRTGEDRQAWIVDGDKTYAVTKGDKVNGATVLRIENEQVVTTAGTIR